MPVKCLVVRSQFFNLTLLSFGIIHQECYKPVCLHTFVLLLISLRDSRQSLGCVAFDTSSSIFSEYEPYGAVLNATVLIQRKVFALFLANM